MSKTFTSGNDCKHSNVLYKQSTVNFYLFELVMIYKVCIGCHALIRKNKRWKFRLL